MTYQEGQMNYFLEAMAIFIRSQEPKLTMAALKDTCGAIAQLRSMGLRDEQIWQAWDSGKSPYLERQQNLFNPAVKK